MGKHLAQFRRKLLDRDEHGVARPIHAGCFDLQREFADGRVDRFHRAARRQFGNGARHCRDFFAQALDAALACLQRLGMTVFFRAAAETHVFEAGCKAGDFFL